MKVRLSGWQRLWIVISILYLFAVIGVLVMSWPTPETTWHREEFIAQMPADLRAHVDGAYATIYQWQTANGLAADAHPGRQGKLPAGAILSSEPVYFANGAVLQVHVAKEGDTEHDARVGVAYWAVVHSVTRAARWTAVWQFALLWLVPCLTLYVLGWAAAWVRRGFTLSRDRVHK